jgi:hypothetical protein
LATIENIVARTSGQSVRTLGTRQSIVARIADYLIIADVA